MTTSASRRMSRDDLAVYATKGLDGIRQKGVNLQAANDAQGGYAVPEDLESAIAAIELYLSPIRQVVRVRDAETTNVRQTISVGGTVSGWVSETDDRPQTDSPELVERLAVFGEIYARPRTYQHILEDAVFPLDDWLAEEVGREFAERQGVAFLAGDGTDKPVGLLNGLTAGAAAAANDEDGSYEIISTGVANALGADADAIITLLRSVVRSLTKGYRPGAVWMMNENTLEVIADLQDGSGRYFLQQNLADGTEARLLGYPVVINNDMDDIYPGASASFPIMFGNFRRAYTVVDRTGISMLRDPFTNPGSVMFYTRKRVGSMKLDANAVKVVTVPAS